MVVAAVVLAQLLERVVIPANTFRAGSPPSGAFLTAKEREQAAANGVVNWMQGPYFREQPVQGISSMVPADDGTWWALSDNGYARRDNSADFQLVFHRIDLRGPKVLESVVLRDPDQRVPWAILCDPARGSPLPRYSFNAMPARPPACGTDPAARILTGFDFDPESFVRMKDGTFWIGEEYGPFLLHVAEDGRLLETPVPVPGVRSPQSPLLTSGEKPNLASSRGFEGLAVAPDGRKLWGLLEGAVVGDDARDLRLYTFDVAKRAFAKKFSRVRLEMPSKTVDAPDSPEGFDSMGEIKAVNDHQLLMIERDDLGDGVPPPKLKKIFLLDISGKQVKKTLVLDLLAIPDPSHVAGGGDVFQLPFFCIESVYVLDGSRILVATDNNYPTSNGRSRSRGADRTGPLAPDDTEIAIIRVDLNGGPVTPGPPTPATPPLSDPGPGTSSR